MFVHDRDHAQQEAAFSDVEDMIENHLRVMGVHVTPVVVVYIAALVGKGESLQEIRRILVNYVDGGFVGHSNPCLSSWHVADAMRRFAKATRFDGGERIKLSLEELEAHRLQLLREYLWGHREQFCGKCEDAALFETWLAGD